VGNDNVLHEAFVRGDVDAIRAALGSPPGFPNSQGPDWVGNLLVYAIYWSPLPAVRSLLDLGADATYEGNDGFPPLVAVIDRRSQGGIDDRVEVIRLLLERGADPNLRGVNDGTPLHQVVWKRDRWPASVEAARTLMAFGADPHLRTRIDDCTSALEDAGAVGARDLVEVLRTAES
jgi:uncharacterized protein